LALKTWDSKEIARFSPQKLRQDLLIDPNGAKLRLVWECFVTPIGPLYTRVGGNKASLDGVNEYRLEAYATLLFGASSDGSRLCG
jgi:hypothetical protein